MKGPAFPLQTRASSKLGPFADACDFACGHFCPRILKATAASVNSERAENGGDTQRSGSHTFERRTHVAGDIHNVSSAEALQQGPTLCLSSVTDVKAPLDDLYHKMTTNRTVSHHCKLGRPRARPRSVALMSCPLLLCLTEFGPLPNIALRHAGPCQKTRRGLLGTGGVHTSAGGVSEGTDRLMPQLARLRFLLLSHRVEPACTSSRLGNTSQSALRLVARLAGRPSTSGAIALLPIRPIALTCPAVTLPLAVVGVPCSPPSICFARIQEYLFAIPSLRAVCKKTLYFELGSQNVNGLSVCAPSNLRDLVGKNSKLGI